jgi:prefoldin subunit 5
MMDDRIKARLEQLRQEYAAGQEQVRALEERLANLNNTLLRIAGAITVLEEMQAEEGRS